jgi:hypothetical protein
MASSVVKLTGAFAMRARSHRLKNFATRRKRTSATTMIRPMKKIWSGCMVWGVRWRSVGRF